MTTTQKTIMRLLEREESLTVHGAYIGDVLALQVQGLVTVRLIEAGVGNGKLEVRKKGCEQNGLSLT